MEMRTGRAPAFVRKPWYVFVNPSMPIPPGVVVHLAMSVADRARVATYSPPRNMRTMMAAMLRARTRTQTPQRRRLLRRRAMYVVASGELDDMSFAGQQLLAE